MEGKSSTKDFLQRCHKEVVEPALDNGLDYECYYLYLSVMYQALEGDAGVRRKFKKMLDEARDKVIEGFNSDNDKLWQEHYYVVFRRQVDFILKLSDFAKGNVKDRETLKLARAIWQFSELQLHNQKRLLDCIERSIHPGSGVKAKEDFRHFDTAKDRYELALNLVNEYADMFK
ncbi:hypothetical protein IJM16_04060 [Candidatus Saccharibacteria bacterium]|nr:hypothetical protein [Candidatus Saccharibacteria bacterium]